MEKEILEVTALAYGGKSIARRSNGKVCFFSGGLPGEKAVIAVTEEKKNYSVGKLLEILTPSPERIPHPCPYGGICPSCPYGCMQYELEWQWKEKQFHSFLDKMKKFHPQNILPGTPAPSRWHYRNKIKLAIEKKGKKILAGYRGEDNTTLIPVARCLLAEKEILEEMEKAPWESPSFRQEKSIIFRHTPQEKVHLLKENSPVFPLTENLGKFGSFLTGSNSFFQINRNMAEKLAERVLVHIGKAAPKEIVELYSGCGVFSCLAAEKFSIRTIGVELDKSNTALAAENAALHNCQPLCRFICGDAGRELGKLLNGKKFSSGTLLLVDPPRTGVDKEGIRIIRESEPDFLLYISCGAPTLLRDLEALQDLYRWENTEILDLFPGTSHFESISLLKHL